MSAPTQDHGGFTEHEMRHILKLACDAAGLDATGAVLLRGHTNAVVRLATAPVVVKIARRGTRVAEVHNTVRFVRWLMDQGFPTAPLYPVPQQPVIVDGHAATFWTYLPQPEDPVSAEQLAEPLYALHALPAPPFPVRPLDNIAAIRASLAAITSLTEDSCRFLIDWLDRLEADLAGVDYVLPKAVLQGDPQHRNALHDSGGAVLCDWDTIAFGHPEWDLVTVEIHCRRFGHGTTHYRAFAKRYGFDVTAWDGYPVLRDLRELRMIATNAKKAHASTTLEEVNRRIEGLRDEDTMLRWHIL
jgi:aminoglycoside phosphotransferase (APT) family kinase protein